MVKSLAWSKALLESGYVHTRKMPSFLNIWNCGQINQRKTSGQKKAQDDLFWMCCKQ